MKQAVVLIHGIGEQRPTQTLRSFVSAITEGATYYNKPDRVGSVSELRRLKVAKDRLKKIPDTDYYEFYWAHNIPAGWGAIVSWLMKILCSCLTRRDDSLVKAIWLMMAVLLIAFFGLYAFMGKINVADHALVKSAISLIAPAFAARFVYNYVGKASAYMNPAPENILYRHKIRKEGVALLKNLHRSNKYSRIIVVGHSLGSVIGYDIIRQYWSNVAIKSHVQNLKRKVVEDFRKEAGRLGDAPVPDALDDFQDAQCKVWRQLRENGFPWLITDFITLGSPLAHAPMLLSETEEEFAARKAEREYAECPPCGQEKTDRSFLYYYNKDFPEGRRAVAILEDDCPFLCTRWTNVYYAPHSLIHGDPIGGALAKYFGPGIKDVGITTRKPWSCHVKYWDVASGTDPGSRTALNLLRSIIRVDDELAECECPSA